MHKSMKNYVLSHSLIYFSQLLITRLISTAKRHSSTFPSAVISTSLTLYVQKISCQLTSVDEQNVSLLKFEDTYLRVSSIKKITGICSKIYTFQYFRCPFTQKFNCACWYVIVDFILENSFSLECSANRNRILFVLKTTYKL